MISSEDLSTQCPATWCPGCGNFGIWAAFKKAAIQQGWNNKNAVLIAGIGCHGNILNLIKITSFEGLHGRAVPLAAGVKLANPNLNVFVFTGDGDALGEGGNHFIHASRRNQNLTVLLHNNGVYGLTTGQSSPASPQGFKSKSTPQGNLDPALSPLSLAIASGATFVARALASDIPHLTELIIKASEHQGFSVIDILQSCITWNKDYTGAFYRENSYYLDKNHDVKDKEAAFKKSLEWGPKQIPLGIFYQEKRPLTQPQLKKSCLLKTTPSKKDLSYLFEQYT